MTNEEKLHLITMNLEETLTVDELKQLIESGKPLKHYIGYEVSGKVHLGAVSAMLKIRDLQMAGVETNVFIADWHTWLNKKLDGTLETAKRMAVEYFQEALKAAGGVTDKADSVYLSKNLNLAQKVSDGMKIYIPRAQEAGRSATPAVGAGLVPALGPGHPRGVPLQNYQ